MQGTVATRAVVHMELTDGVSVSGPEEIMLRRTSLGFFGDIIDIVCRLTGACGGDTGGGTGGGGDGCTTIIIQDGGGTTTITRCPPKLV
jgi:hypothetical protein